MLMFGSVAAKYWFPDFREPKDYDFMTKLSRNEANPILPYKLTEYHWTPAFQYILDNNKDSMFVDPDFLYTIKVSHAAWDVKWEKTMKDIAFFQREGCKLDMTLYELLIKDWEQVHKKKRVKLKGKPEDFFTSQVSRKVPHEDLHNMVKFYDAPLHERIRPDKNDVKVDKSLWDDLSYEDKLKCALEETYVFALERYLALPPNHAFSKALKNLITSATKGWFTLFLILNFEVLMGYNKDNYYNFYKQAKELS